MASASVNVTVTIPADVVRAIRQVSKATEALAAIASLPTRIGARVRWKVNGLVWERIGEDTWLPIHEGEFAGAERIPAPSAHIASGAFEDIE